MTLQKKSKLIRSIIPLLIIGASMTYANLVQAQVTVVTRGISCLTDFQFNDTMSSIKVERTTPNPSG